MNAKRILSVILTLILISTVFVGSVSAFSGGSGTEDDPYLIYDADDLQEIKDYPTAYFSIEAEIYLNDYNWTQIPAGFSGHIEGNWNVIHNFTSNNSMFADLNSGASIADLFFVDANVTYDGTGTCGIIASKIYDNVYLYGVNVNVCNITSNTGSVAGLFGTATSNSSSMITIDSCNLNNCTIKGTTGAAGIVVNSQNASPITISSCKVNTCNIISKSGTVGGGIGESCAETTISDLQLTNCIVRTEESALPVDFAGGMVGSCDVSAMLTVSNSSLTNCFVQAPNVGGIVSSVVGELSFSGITVKSCTIASSSNSGYAGGLCPYNGSNAYSISDVHVSMCEVVGGAVASGIIYSNFLSGTLEDSDVHSSNVYGIEHTYDATNQDESGTVITVVSHNPDEYLKMDLSGVTTSFDSDLQTLTFDIKVDGETGIRGAVVVPNPEGSGTKAGASFSLNGEGESFVDYVFANENGNFSIDWWYRPQGYYHGEIVFKNPLATSSTITIPDIPVIPPFVINNFTLMGVTTGSIGQVITGYSWISGGQAPYTYKWYKSSDGKATWVETTSIGEYDDYPAFTFDAVGTYYLKFTVTDSSPTPQTLDSITVCPDVYITIDDNPSINYAEFYPNHAPDGSSISMRASVNNPRSNPLTYQWIDPYGNIVGTALTGNFVYVAGGGGEDIYTFKVTDTVTGDEVTVTPSMYEETYTEQLFINKKFVPLNTTANIELSLDTYGYNVVFQKSLDEINWTNMTDNKDTFNDSVATKHCYRAIVDYWGGYYATCAVYCVTGISINLDSMIVTPSLGTVDSTYTFSATASGGTPPFTYTWYASKDGVWNWGSPIGTGQILNKQFTEVGNYYYKCIITDSATLTAFTDSYDDYEIYKDVHFRVGTGVEIDNMTVTPTSGGVGTVINLSASISSGTPPYTVTWYASDDPWYDWYSPIGTGETLSYTATSEGLFYFKCVVTDSSSPQKTVDSWDDYDTYGEKTVEIYNPIIIDSILVTPEEVEIGEECHVLATATGGYTDLDGYWYVSKNNPNNWSVKGFGMTTSFSFSESGLYYIKCSVRDYAGHSSDSYADYTTWKNVTVKVGGGGEEPSIWEKIVSNTDNLATSAVVLLGALGTALAGIVVFSIVKNNGNFDKSMLIAMASVVVITFIIIIMAGQMSSATTDIFNILK